MVPIFFPWSFEKFKDTILFGAQRGELHIPDAYVVDNIGYIDSLKKHNHKAKRKVKWQNKNLIKSVTLSIG